MLLLTTIGIIKIRKITTRTTGLFLDAGCKQLVSVKLGLINYNNYSWRYVHCRDDVTNIQYGKSSRKIIVSLYWVGRISAIGLNVQEKPGWDRTDRRIAVHNASSNGEGRVMMSDWLQQATTETGDDRTEDIINAVQLYRSFQTRCRRLRRHGTTPSVWFR